MADCEMLVIPPPLRHKVFYILHAVSHPGVQALQLLVGNHLSDMDEPVARRRILVQVLPSMSTGQGLTPPPLPLAAHQRAQGTIHRHTCRP